MATAAEPGRRIAIWAGAFVGVLALGGVALYLALSPGAKPTPKERPPEVAVARPAEVATKPPDPTPTPLPPPTPVPMPVAFNPADAFLQVFEQRDSDNPVTIDLDQTKVRIGKDKLRFRVRSAKAGYLYVLMVGTDREKLLVLFPNEFDAKNQIDAGRELSLPRPGWAITAEGPAGTNQFVALVTPHKHDFSELGMTRNGPFSEMAMDKVQNLVRQGAGSVLAGKAVCGAIPAAQCPASYGAGRFTIEEVN